MNTARKWLSVLMAVCLMFICGAIAEQVDPIEVTVEATGTEMSGPGEIQVSLRVANVTKEDITDPVTLLDPSGKPVESFGDNGQLQLKADGFYTWQGSWQVSQEELDKGRAVYQVQYHQQDASGMIFTVTLDAPVALTYSMEKAGLNATRTITPEVCREGKQVKVTYDLVNNGNVELTKVRVSEKISNRVETIDKLPVGGRKTVTFIAVMGNKDLVSGATIAYNVAGEDETQREEFVDITVPKAVNDLSVKAEAVTPSVNIGEPAVIKVIFSNNGNITYSNVTVRDDQRGEIFTGLEIPAGTVVEKEREFTLTEPATFKMTAALNDNTGESHTMNFEPVSVQVYDPEKTLRLSLDLKCDHDTIPSQPAVVRFTLNVTNNSDIEATGITIRHGNTVMQTLSALGAGKTAKLEWDANLSQGGKYRFTATTKDTLGNNMTFESNTLEIPYVPPTQPPVTEAPVTVAPLVTSPPPVLEDVNSILRNGWNVASILALVLGGLLAVSLILFLAASAKRTAAKHRSDNAYDHLDLSDKRDYSEEGDGRPMDDGKAPRVVTPEREAEYVSDDDDAPEPDVSVEDVIRAREEKPETEEEPLEADGFRVSRRDETAQDAPAEDTVRHRRSGNKNV